MKKPAAKKNPSRFRHISKPQIFTREEIDLSNAKVNIHIRLDADIVRYFKEKAAWEGEIPDIAQPSSGSVCPSPSPQPSPSRGEGVNIPSPWRGGLGRGVLRRQRAGAI